MSAYMVSSGHIRYLIHAALTLSVGGEGQGRSFWVGHNGKRFELRDDGLEEIEAEACGILLPSVAGRLLWEENRKSIQARYPKDWETLMPEEAIDAWEWRSPAGSLGPEDVAQVLKAIACYSYQSCEHGEAWESSFAKAFVDALEHHAIWCLPGMDDAKWGAPDSYEVETAR